MLSHSVRNVGSTEYSTVPGLVRSRYQIERGVEVDSVVVVKFVSLLVVELVLGQAL